jgi:hypothetical protein
VSPAALDSPAALVAAARAVLDRADALPGSAWSRATALLARQALEEALADFWRRVAPGAEDGTFTAKLLCLRGYVPAEVATDAHQVWAALSDACHHHAYDLAPTAGELHRWVERTAELVAALARESPPPTLRS